MLSRQFFKPTPLYKEYMILDLIDKNPIITQRDLSKKIDSSVSMINLYLDDYEKKGYLKKRYLSDKKIEYLITKKGIERKKLLNICYLKASHYIYSNAKENIKIFIDQIYEKGFNNILLYGAGEVAELLLLVVNDYNKLNVIGIIDDDLNKQGKYLLNVPIFSDDMIERFGYDAILISNYVSRDIIYDKLINKGYPKERIIMFIEI